MKAREQFNLTTSFFRHATMTPDKIALVLDGKEYTYLFLATLAMQIAKWLEEKK